MNAEFCEADSGDKTDVTCSDDSDIHGITSGEAFSDQLSASGWKLASLLMADC
jgi:hypothetical protein